MLLSMVIKPWRDTVASQCNKALNQLFQRVRLTYNDEKEYSVKCHFNSKSIYFFAEFSIRIFENFTPIPPILWFMIGIVKV